MSPGNGWNWKWPNVVEKKWNGPFLMHIFDKQCEIMQKIKYMKYKIHSSLSVRANPWKSLLNFFPLYHRGEVGRGGGVPSERALQLGVHQTRWISPLPLANCHSIKSHTHFLPIIYCQIKPPFAVWLYHSGEKTNCLIISENSHNFHSNKTPLFFFLLVPTGVPLMINDHWSCATSGPQQR